MDTSGNAASPAPSSELDPDEARRLLERTEGVRRAARADARGLAIPLLVLGVLTLGYAALSYVQLNVIASDLGPGESRAATPEEMAFGDLLGLVGLSDAVSVHAIVQADVVAMAAFGLVLMMVAMRSWRSAGARRPAPEPVAS